MGLVLEMHVTGQEKIKLMLDGVALRARNLTPVWGQIADDFRQVEERQFATEGGFTAKGRWEQLSPAYAAWKATHFPGRKILELTGALKASLTGGAGHIDRRTPDSVTLGTSIRSKKGKPYPVYHQVGAPPNLKREPIAIPQTAQDRWVKMIQAYLAGGDIGAIMTRTSLF